MAQLPVDHHVDTRLSLDDLAGVAVAGPSRTAAAARGREVGSTPAAASMRRHVAMIAPPWYPVPPNGYGGIEVLVSLLANELRERGHRVTLFAAAGSAAPAVVHAPVEWTADLGQREERLRELTYGARILESLRHRGDVDVIHDHVGYGTLLAASQLADVPVVHTVHGALSEPESTFYAALSGRVDLVAISGSQRRSAPDLPWIGTVHNAVPLHHLSVGGDDDASPYLMCLARICPDKGQHIAIEVARRTGLRLILAGKVETTPSSRDYYATQVLPLVDGDRVVHLSNVAGNHKAMLLAGATALLAPIQWDEPFGLSVVEAMAAGTPAISFGRGAARELIDDGITGFVVDDVDGMVAAVGRVAEIDRVVCAAVTCRRFSPAAMADGYLRMYERVESSASLHPLDPTATVATS